jgi:hypothetical protein
LELTAAQPVDLQAVAGGRRQLNARSLGVSPRRECAIEFLLELLLQLVFEVVLQIVLEIAAALGWESLKHSLRREHESKVFLASLGHFLLGVMAGFASLLVFDQRLTPRAAVPGLSLILSPLATGMTMNWLGKFWRRRSRERPALFTFRGGAIFAFGMALVRLVVFRTSLTPGSKA